MVTIKANSADELLEVLNNIDISVPPRTGGRTTEDTERYAIIRYLRSIIHSNHISFPLVLTHRDKPDFFLEMNSDQIGIECTEAIPEQYAWAHALYEKHFPDGLFEPDLFRWDSPTRTKEEIIGLLRRTQNGLHGPGWMGDSVEKEWSKWMSGCIESKTRKLNSAHFEKFEINQLLVYDNLPQAANDLEKSTNMLLKELDRITSINELNFNSVVIESGQVLIQIQIKPQNIEVLPLK